MIGSAGVSVRASMDTTAGQDTAAGGRAWTSSARSRRRGWSVGNCAMVSPFCAPGAHTRELWKPGRLCRRSIRPTAGDDVVFAWAIRDEWRRSRRPRFGAPGSPRPLDVRLQAILAAIAWVSKWPDSALELGGALRPSTTLRPLPRAAGRDVALARRTRRPIAARIRRFANPAILVVLTHRITPHDRRLSRRRRELDPGRPAAARIPPGTGRVLDDAAQECFRTTIGG